MCTNKTELENYYRGPERRNLHPDGASFHDVRTNIVAHTMERYRNCLECAFQQHELHEYYKGHNGGKDTDEIHPSNTSIPEWMTQKR